MEYANHLNEYVAAPSVEEVAREVAALREAAAENHNADVYRFCYSAIDLTTLSCNDSTASVSAFAERCMEFYTAYPHIPNVASICIYPSFVETVGLVVDGSPMRITAVAGGFPSSQTFLEVKMLEAAMAIENGADEIDIVLNAGKMLTGAYDEAANEIEVLRAESAGTVLKVILETGALKTPELIRKASLLSMFDGQDRRRRDARSGRGHVSRHTRLPRAHGTPRGLQGRGRSAFGRGCRAVLHHRGADLGPRVAHRRSVPHRSVVGRQQSALGDRGTRGEVLLTAEKRVTHSPTNSETGCPTNCRTSYFP